MEALYFPYLSLPAATWVNPALLYFDRLGIIAPEGSRKGLFDHRTRQLLDLDMAVPVVPRREWEPLDDEKLVSFILGRSAATTGHGRVERVHVGKLAYGRIADVLIGAGLLVRVDGEWFEGPDWVIAHIMSYLALQLSTHAPEPLPLITNEIAAAEIISGEPERRSVSRRVRAVTCLLPVPPDARPADIARFRRNHRADLNAFRDYVDDLIALDPSTGEGEDRFRARLGEAERLRDNLVGELAAFEWRWQGPAFVISAAVTAASVLDHSPWSFGAGLISLGFGGVQGLAAWRRSHQAASNPLVYATQAVGKWQPTAASTLR